MASRFDVHRRDQGWSWRLLGANNRAVARCPYPYPDAAQARRDAARVAAIAVTGRVEIIGNGRGWRWVLVDDSGVRAVSAATFVRLSDGRRAVVRFRSTATSATLPAPPSDVDGRPGCGAGVVRTRT